MKKAWYFLFGSKTSWGLIPGIFKGIKEAWINAKISVKHL